VIPLEWMAPLMFGGLVLFMLIGFPVTFSLAAVGLFFGFIAIESGYFDFALLQALPERVFGIVSNDTLLAIPFLHPDGRDPGALRAGGRPAGRPGPAVRPEPGGLGYA
jgi:TRAP-type mannitol/chloroaromatic compound transport system permease large subunit